MAVSKYVKEHFKVGYFALIEAIPHIRGLKLTIPLNIFIGSGEEVFIYEIDGLTLNIYNGSRKIETHKCPEYTSRNFILYDISSRLRFNGIDPDLLQVKKGAKKLGSDGVLTLISPPESTADQELEQELNQFIISTDSNYLNPPRKIAEGCKILFENFLKEKK